MSPHVSSEHYPNILAVARSSSAGNLRLRDTDSGWGHTVKSNVYNFYADAYTVINESGKQTAGSQAV